MLPKSRWISIIDKGQASLEDTYVAILISMGINLVAAATIGSTLGGIFWSTYATFTGAGP